MTVKTGIKIGNKNINKTENVRDTASKIAKLEHTRLHLQNYGA